MQEWGISKARVGDRQCKSGGIKGEFFLSRPIFHTFVFLARTLYSIELSSSIGHSYCASRLLVPVITT